jgi:predicted protein tyrosine phosphatase
MWRLPYLIMVSTFLPNFLYKNNYYLIFSSFNAFLLFLYITSLGNFDNANLKVISMMINLLTLFIFIFIDYKFSFFIFVLFWLPMVYYFRVMLFVESLTKITDYVYVGNIKAAANKNLLKTHNISAIVEVHDAYKNSKRIEGVEYLSLEFEDRNFTDLTLFIQKSNEFINQKIKEKKVVLVHCSGGISRSVSLVLAHLIESGLSFDEAFKKVRKVRSIVDINYGFRDQLKKLEK